MATYQDVNGIPFTDEDIEQWAATAESEEGYTGKHLGTSVAGRPISVGMAASPFTVRLDAARRAKLDEIAHAKETTPSQLIRDLIDAL